MVHWIGNQCSEWHGSLITHYFVSILSWVLKGSKFGSGHRGAIIHILNSLFKRLFFCYSLQMVWSHYFASILGWVLEVRRLAPGVRVPRRVQIRLPRILDLVSAREQQFFSHFAFSYSPGLGWIQQLSSHFDLAWLLPQFVVRLLQAIPPLISFWSNDLTGLISTSISPIFW